jgi:methylated-DNA-protein-cysteine methyltransferase-like protein
MTKPLSHTRAVATSARQAARRTPRKRAARAARGDSSRDRIYAQVRRVPRGKVATYGQIARLAGLEGQARQVGYAMAAVPSSSAVPWHRVINAQGRVSMRSEGPGGSIIQQQLLEREGIVFDAGGRVALSRFGWKPRRS